VSGYHYTDDLSKNRPTINTFPELDTETLQGKITHADVNWVRDEAPNFENAGHDNVLPTAVTSKSLRIAIFSY
jgi:hypothetical protein